MIRIAVLYIGDDSNFDYIIIKDNIIIYSVSPEILNDA